MLLARWLFITTVGTTRSAFVLSGERVQFAPAMTPRFTARQMETSNPATRAGLAKWAKTAEGRKLIEFFRATEYEIRVTESEAEEAARTRAATGVGDAVRRARSLQAQNVRAHSQSDILPDA